MDGICQAGKAYSTCRKPDLFFQGVDWPSNYIWDFLPSTPWICLGETNRNGTRDLQLDRRKG